MKKALKIVALLMAFVILTPFTSIAADNEMPVTASGFPVKYNTPYYIFPKTLGDRGGVMFEAYLNRDYVLFANEKNYRGFPVIFLGGNGEIPYGGNVEIRSTDSNWGNPWYYWYRSDVDIVLNNTPSQFKMFGTKSDKSVGFLQNMQVQLVPNNTGKAWITGKSFNNDISRLETPFLLYETDYKPGFVSLNYSSNQVKFILKENYFNAPIRFRLTLNGQYIGESYAGKSYYASNSKNLNNVEVTVSNKTLQKGDVIELSVVTGYPGQTFAVLQQVAKVIVN